MSTKFYTTLREAAIAGTQAAIEQAKATGWEWGGIVYEDKAGKGFFCSDLQTSYDPHKVETSGDRRIGKLAGCFHVHIKEEADTSEHNTEFFSPGDIEGVIYLRSFAFLGSTGTGKIYELDARSAEQFYASVTAMAIAPELIAKGQPLTECVAVRGVEIHGGYEEAKAQAA